MVNSKITALLFLLASGLQTATAVPRDNLNGNGVEAARNNLEERDIRIAENVLVIPDQRGRGNVKVSKKKTSRLLNSIHIDLDFGTTCANVGEECEEDDDCCPNWTACTGGYCRKL